MTREPRGRAPASPERQRVKIAEAVSILGLEARTIRDMAARGQISGAAKPRGIWTFDRDGLQQYLRDCEAEVQQRAESLQINRVAPARPTNTRRPRPLHADSISAVIERLRKLAKARPDE
ncbi:helix-turn-helix domain-containing protein [uncultured Bradyrhizobium sp.]|jgi:hypothetical protein|uniref:helix-turn-helix domain-containing protein n=1 Tax=uncultured Bradyrhizobium sp. TaxID=199684 RepID=UPI00345C151C